MISVDDILDVAKITEQKQQTLKKYKTLINAVRCCKSDDKNTIAKTAKMSWQTINNFLAGYVGENQPIVVDENIYKVNPDYGVFLGIAVGARETKVTLVDFSLNGITEEFSKKYQLEALFKELDKIPTAKSCSSCMICYETLDDLAYISNICNGVIQVALKFFCGKYDLNLLGIGLTFPGIINKNNLQIEFCPNIDCLNGVYILNFLQEELLADINRKSLSLCIAHDTAAITVFEKENLYKSSDKYKYKNLENVICLYMGMGLGCGIIINNQLLSGKNNSFGEIGHIPAPDMNEIICRQDENNHVKYTKEEQQDKEYYAEEENIDLSSVANCYCREPSCIEKMIRVQVFNSKTPEQLLEKTKPQYLENFHNEHPFRYRVFKQYLKYLFTIIINLFNPDLIILSGRTLNSIPALRTDAYILKQSAGIELPASECKIINGSDRPDCVAVGAGILAYYKLVESNGENDEDGMKFNISWNPVIE